MRKILNKFIERIKDCPPPCDGSCDDCNKWIRPEMKTTNPRLCKECEQDRKWFNGLKEKHRNNKYYKM